MKKLIRAECTGKTSQGIYCNITHSHSMFLRKTKIITREAFLRILPAISERLGRTYYDMYANWQDTGKEIEGFFGASVQKEMIRQYEFNK